MGVDWAAGLHDLFICSVELRFLGSWIAYSLEYRFNLFGGILKLYSLECAFTSDIISQS